MKKRWYHLTRVCALLVSVLLLVGCGAGQSADADGKADGEITEENEFVENEYDEILLDKKKTDGKLAVYFFRTSDSWKYQGGFLHGGDSILYVTPDNKTMLVDCGTPNNGAYVVYALQQLGIEKLDYFINSHPHNDHIGGFSILARYIEIGEVYTAPVEKEFQDGGTTRALNTTFTRKVKELGIPHKYLVEGDSLTLGKDVNIKIYNPPVDFDYDKMDYNECSVLMKVTYKDSSFLSGGDIGNSLATHGRASTTELIAKFGSELQADVLKMNHHGAFIGTTGLDDWIETVSAKICVGTTNSMESEEDLLLYGFEGAEAFHSALDGNVCISTTGDGTYDVQVGQERLNDYYGKPDTKDGFMHVE